LTTVALNAPLHNAAAGFVRANGDGDMLGGLCEALRFGPMTRRRLMAAAGLQSPSTPASEFA